MWHLCFLYKIRVIRVILFIQVIWVNVIYPVKGLLPQPGAALPHFGRDGKSRDTCYFYPFDKFFVYFLPFFAPLSLDFAHCVTCF